MLSKTHSIIQFLKYYFCAQTYKSLPKGSIQDFLVHCIETPLNSSKAEEIEKIREILSNDNKEIEVIDFGAGSKTLGTKHRKISAIAKTSVSPRFQCEFLSKITQEYAPNTRLEIGTSLGISTMYQALDGNYTKFYSLEGSPNIAKIAQENFNTFNVDIKLLTGEFDKTFPQIFNEIDTLDYALIDGNHRKKATLQYFNLCLTKINKKSILIFDDIYWSKEMTDAWKIIKSDQRVSYTIDVYFFGLVFFNEDTGIQKNYIAIPSKFKFWKK